MACCLQAQYQVESIEDIAKSAGRMGSGRSLLCGYFKNVREDVYVR